MGPPESGPDSGSTLLATLPWRLPQKLADLDDPANREAFLKALTHGSAVSWQHVNLPGEYDFSEGRLQDTVGIKPPKLAD